MYLLITVLILKFQSRTTEMSSYESPTGNISSSHTARFGLFLVCNFILRNSFSCFDFCLVIVTLCGLCLGKKPVYELEYMNLVAFYPVSNI